MPHSSTRGRLRFPATVAGLGDAAARLRGLLDAQNIEGDVRYNVELVFEEIAANIMRHALPTGDVDLSIWFDPTEILLVFEDDGMPFDPRQHPDPVEPTSLDDAPLGGLGLVLVKRVVTRIDYERTAENHNRLTLALPLRAGQPAGG